MLDDNRNFPRIRKTLRIGIQDPAEKYIMLHSKDFSCGGVSFSSKEGARAGRYVVFIPYMVRNGLHVLSVQAESAYSIYDMQEKTYTLGLKFVDIDVQTFNRLEYLSDRLYDYDVAEINKMFEQQYSFVAPKVR